MQVYSSSFEKPKSMATVVEKLNTKIPIELDDTTIIDGNTFFKVDISCIYKIFEAHEYKKSITIRPAIN